MNWLFDNPVVNLPGSYFLILYAVVIAAAIAVCRYFVNQADETAHLPLPPVPREPDPYEIAFLRGGANELVRSLIFNLTQSGYLQVSVQQKETWITRTNNVPNQTALKAIELKTLGHFQVATTAAQIFDSTGLAATLEPFITTYEARLNARGMMPSDAMRAKVSRITVVASLIVAGLGLYKLAAALLAGYDNVLFLLFLGAIGFTIVRNVSRVPRVTKLGKAYLARLQLAFEGLKAEARGDQLQPALAASGGTTMTSVDPMLLMVGVFGIGALSGTAHSEYMRAFKRGQYGTSSGADSGGCGSSCSSSGDSSSSSDGGSSCGGGCGGCGGGD